MRPHSDLSPSKGERILRCPEGINLERDLYPDRESSSFADEGTLAHEIAEFELLNMRAKPSQEVLDQSYTKFDLEAKKHGTTRLEMMQDLQPYLDYCSSLLYAATHYEIEKRVSLHFIHHEMFGTADFVALVGETLHVVDLKFGKGVQVDAQDNVQLKLYALGALYAFTSMAREEYTISSVVCTIVQPRLNHITEATYKPFDLSIWGAEEMAPKAALAYEGKGGFSAGSHCKFCKLKGQCRTFKDWSYTLENNSYTAHPNLLTDDELSEIMDAEGRFDDLVKAVKAESLHRMINGKNIKGYMLTQSLGNRTWVDEQDALSNLQLNFEESVYSETKIKSVAQVEKSLGKKNAELFLKNLVHRPKGDVKIVKYDPKKKPYNPAEASLDLLDSLD